MYATLEESPGLVAARALADRVAGRTEAALPVLEEQVGAEAGLWSQGAARRALAQAGGDVSRAVALVRVWAATLPQLPPVTAGPDDVMLVRRVSAAFADVPGGQWLGAAPELASRLLAWDDPDAPTDAPASAARHDGGSDRIDVLATGAPTRAECPRVRDLLDRVPIAPVADDGPGPDPARAPLVAPFARSATLTALAQGETGALVGMASLALAGRREAVLAEVTTAAVTVRVAHPRSGVPCALARVTVVEAEAIVDADVGGRPGVALGWGASLGSLERRALAVAVIDGTLQAGGGITAETVLAATEGMATAGFVDHLRLPHHASFGSYLDRVRAAPPVPGALHDCEEVE